MASSRHTQQLYELGSRREIARREEVWRKWYRDHAMFPSLLEGDRGCVSPLGGVAVTDDGKTKR
jgi:hypothetical protein